MGGPVCFQKWDVIDELVLRKSGPLPDPARHAILSRVVAGQGEVRAAKAIHQILEVAHPQPDVGLGLRQDWRIEASGAIEPVSSRNIEPPVVRIKTASVSRENARCPPGT